MSGSGHSDGFVEALVEAQFELYSYIVVLMGGTQEAQDVLQNTNRQIIRLAGERGDVENFVGWAKRMAYYQVRTWRATQRRERLVFDDEVFEQIAGRVSQREYPVTARMEALNMCLRRLSEKMRGLFWARHVDNVGVQELALQEGRSPESVSVTLHRVRQTLRKCILQELKRAGV